ncbi:MAG: hypothetical protein KGI00_04100 [Candidatus Micrarchaeota archaeon]|nr:hypothetical protein [Candidatus Micrarchaeota archaeon]MDE1824395.1 hypothetical protein [Candidatus Micrarchaeota archaeon]MDE1849882.1 hypothetical protein [Candidatus Micrarchaeota archaeon]
MDADGGSPTQVSEVERLAGLEAIVEAVSNSSVDVVTSELAKTMRDERVRAHMKDGIIAYLYAAGFLSFAGREINRENLSKVVSAIGIRPNDALIDIVIGAGVKNHLVYVYAFYYLLANGLERSDENIRKVMNAIGMEADKEGYGDVLPFVPR